MILNCENCNELKPVYKRKRNNKYMVLCGNCLILTKEKNKK
jgi:transcription elongation factor Elf1